MTSLTDNVARRYFDHGASEEAGWLEVDGERLFHVTSVPRVPPRGWLLICPSIGGEFDGGYRRQVLLARALAEVGIGVRRFHYRGTGNSEFATSTCRSTMVADGVAAAAELEQQWGSATVFVLGERVGGLIAAEVAAGLRQSHLVLWQPVLDIGAYRRELSRAAKMQDLAAGIESDFKRAYEEGAGDLVGFSVSRPLIESFVDHPLSASSPGPGCTVHLVQFGRSTFDRGYQALLDGWQPETAAVNRVLLQEPELWWFAPGPWKRGEEKRPVNIEAIDRTVRLISEIVDSKPENEA